MSILLLGNHIYALILSKYPCISQFEGKKEFPGYQLQTLDSLINSAGRFVDSLVAVHISW